MNRGPLFRTTPQPLRPTCVVCGELADAASLPTGNNDLPVCRDTSCRMITDKQKSMPAESFKQYLTFQAGFIHSRRDAQKKQEKLKQEKLEAESAEEDLWWAHLRKLEEVRSLDNLLQLKIPNGPRQLVDVSAERRQAHAEHVQAIIAEGIAAPALESPTDDQQSAVAVPQPMAGRLCAMCGGGCCTIGGNTAYLTVDTIRRVISSQPGIHEDELLSQYLRLVPEQSMADSCIYHTPNGCALPRELRSDVCNHYNCPSLTTLLEWPSETDRSQSAVLVLQRRQDHWKQETLGLDNDVIGAALITDACTLPLSPLPAAESASSTGPRDNQGS